MVGVRPAAKRRAGARRFAPANFARAAIAKPLGTAKIKSVDLFGDFYFVVCHMGNLTPYCYYACNDKGG